MTRLNSFHLKRQFVFRVKVSVTIRKTFKITQEMPLEIKTAMVGAISFTTHIYSHPTSLETHSQNGSNFSSTKLCFWFTEFLQSTEVSLSRN